MKGLTLIELLVASALTIILGMVTVMILVSHNGVFFQQSLLVSEGLNLNDMTAELEKQIKQASGIASGYPQESPTYITGNQTLVLRLPGISATGVLTDIFDYVVITKDPSNQNLLLFRVFPTLPSIRSQADRVLTNILQNIDFQFYDNNDNTVNFSEATKVGFTISVVDKTGPVNTSRTASMITSLRNR